MDDRRPTLLFGMFQMAIIDSATRHPIHFMYVRPLYFAFGD